MGYHRGAEIGAEVGYYNGIVEYFLNSDSVRDKKTITKLETLKQSLDNFPKTNVEDVDILDVLNNIRAQFKTICVRLKSNHLLWDEIDSLSF